MPDVFENQRVATRFRVLVEIADRQPAVSQGEIADALDITSQAVSEYIRELKEKNFVEMKGRSQYRITKEGVDWLLQQAEDVKQFADHVSEEVLGSVNEDTAIATGEIAEGEEVTLQMKDGLLHASPGSEGPATGVATTAASEGEDVGVTSFEGIIDLAPGTVTVYQVPRIRAGGSRAIDMEELKNACSDHDLILATGIEAIVALAKINIDPDCIFAVGEIAAEAANRGLNSIVVTATDQVGGVTAPLRSQGTSYEVSQLN